VPNYTSLMISFSFFSPSLSPSVVTSTRSFRCMRMSLTPRVLVTIPLTMIRKQITSLKDYSTKALACTLSYSFIITDFSPSVYLSVVVCRQLLTVVAK
jgi:hypothetical protein